MAVLYVLVRHPPWNGDGGRPARWPDPANLQPNHGFSGFDRLSTFMASNAPVRPCSGRAEDDLKLIRGYRFRREAIKMMKVFFMVWIGGFLLLAGINWLAGRSPMPYLIGLGLTGWILPVLAGLLYAIWATIRTLEKKQGRAWTDEAWSAEHRSNQLDN